MCVDCGMLNVDCGAEGWAARGEGDVQHSIFNIQPLAFNVQHSTGNIQPPTSSRQPATGHSHRGFSFAEVMFAVIILGIGFIMIAGLFPVAIRQSKSTADETSAAAFARVAANYVGMLGTNANMITTYTNNEIGIPQVLALPSSTDPAAIDPQTITLFQSLSGNIISQDDPRYAWVPFYFRGFEPTNTNVALPYAQLILICVQATNYPTFSDLDVHPTSGSLYRNLRGRPVRVSIFNSPAGTPDYIGFEDSASIEKLPNAINAVAEGCFVIIRADATSPGGFSRTGGRTTGRIYRVGVRRPDLDGQNNQKLAIVYYNSAGASQTLSGSSGLVAKDTAVTGTNLQVWELAPGNDFTPEPPTTVAPIIPAANAPGFNATSKKLVSVEAYVVGRSFSNPNNGGAAFEGPAMDVAAYSTFIYCKQ